MSDDKPVPPGIIALMPKIGTDAFGVWMYLYMNSDASGNIDAPYPQISDGTGIKARGTVSNCLKMLVAMGLLEKQKHYNAPVSYRVVLPSSSNGELLSNWNANSYSTIPINTKSIKDSEDKNLKSSESELLDNKHVIKFAFADVRLDNWQRLNDAQQAECLYQKATNLTSIVGRDRDRRILDIVKMVAAYGPAETFDRMKPAYAEWITRRGKDGRMYSKTNLDWIDWAVTGEIPDPIDWTIKPNNNGRKSAAELREEHNAAVFAQVREEMASGKIINGFRNP